MADAPKPEPVVYRLTLRALPGPVPPEVRLRRLLKALLRGYGFRCLKVEYPEEPPAPGPEEEPQP